jgi:hypothetical protein
MKPKKCNSFNELPMQDSEEKLNLNLSAEQLSQKCTEIGEKRKIGREHGKTSSQGECLNGADYGRYGKYTILKKRSTYILQRSGHSLFSSKDRKKIEEVFVNIIKNNGGFLSTSLKSRT